MIRTMLFAGFVASGLVPTWTTEAAADQPVWGTIVSDKPTMAEELGLRDLQRYLGQVTGVVPRVLDSERWQAAPVPAVIVGTPQRNPLLRRFAEACRLLGDQGYLLSNETIGGVRTVIVAGGTPTGVVNAIYGLLRELGFGFYLGSEAIPAGIPDELPGGRVSRAPVLAIRGVLPWYNFFNSPTVWDPEDHRAFVDQLIRSGANFVGFHTYDSEPFAAYQKDGKMVWGERLLNTGAPTWGTRPMPTRDFAGGTDKLFADDFFGARSTQTGGDPREAIRREQDILRDALAYAKSRGLFTCLGFEVNRDPTNAADREVFLARINRLMDQYPSLDYIWIWEPETQGAQGYRAQYNQHILRDRLSLDSPLRLYGVGRREVFKRAVERKAGEKPFFQDNEQGKLARAVEGARLEQFAWLALRAMSHRENPPKLVISGWGGDERLLSAEYYDGLDKLLPADVAFASLDHIFARPRVDRVYSELPASRQRWPIPWLECDGDQWHPQPNVHVYESTARDVINGGSQGVLGIHWRSRDIEENFAYLVEAAWDRDLSADRFFAGLARRCYPPAIAQRMAAIHAELDRLGYRWVGGPGQVECGAFAWGPGEADKVRRLTELRDRTSALVPQAGNSRGRLLWLVGVMDWVLAFQEAQLTAVRAQELLAAAGGDPQKARDRAREAIALLDDGALDRALQAFAVRVTTRGEYGVLATINTKAVAAWRDLRARCAKSLGEQAPPEPKREWKPEPGVLMPRLMTSAPEHTAVELTPVVLGGGDAWLKYRATGTREWRIQQTKVVRGWVQHAELPADAMVSPGVEYAFSLGGSPDSPPAWGPAALTVMPPVQVNKKSRPKRPAPAKPAIEAKAKEGASLPVELAWNDSSEADYFKVIRDGQALAETAVPVCYDAPTSPKVSYVVEAWRDGAVLARSKPVEFAVPDQPVDERPAVKATVNLAGVLLEWPAAQSPHTSGYRVYRQAASSPESENRLLGECDASRSAGHVFRDLPPPGRWRYRVAAVNAVRKEGPAGVAEASFVPHEPARPIADWPLTALPSAASTEGDVAFGPQGATFKGGYIEIPHQPWMDLGTGMTLDFEFKADATGDMPVLLSHGQWQADGWFVQILGDSLIIRTPDGDVHGPRIDAGRWYAVRFVFDAARLHLAVDGKWVDEPQSVVRNVPAGRSLVIGQYSQKQPPFAFRGTIRNVRLYADVLPEAAASRPG
jgi:hypothetical protein